MDRLTTAEIQRRRSRLLASVSVLLGAFALLSVVLSSLDPDILAPLQLTPGAARWGILALTAGFVALVIERDRSLNAHAQLTERYRDASIGLQNRLDVLSSLLDAGDRLNAPLMIQDVLDVVLDAAIDLVGAEGGAVRTFDDDVGEVSVARRHAVVVNPAALEIVEMVDLPLVVDGVEIGMLQLALPRGADDPDLMEVLERFTDGAARALERAHVMAKDRASVAYLRAANVVKSRFLQTVSHELRTPLTSIIGYSSTLEHHWERLPDETKLEFARSIQEQGGRLKMLVERILEAARVELEGVTVHRVVHDVRRSVERACAGLPYDEARLDVALPASEVTGEIDPFVVEQAVQNLVDNALRYTKGRVRLSLDSYRNSIVISVTDEGPGMDPVDLRLVKEPLVRVDENIQSGTGLGLHIVATLVADHGGRFEISSSGNGTQAQVTLPRGGAVAVSQRHTRSA
ncbi:MAG: two-component system, OmpR family, sensor histidine kinase KdpD [Actinomycetota bacterium]|nr:two-component system, OmpR family, sensor histidine kinase KdpD [Actinomycetota bacterium]